MHVVGKSQVQQKMLLCNTMGDTEQMFIFIASPVEDGVESNSLDADYDGEGLSLMQNVGGHLSVQNVLSFAKKRVMAHGIVDATYHQGSYFISMVHCGIDWRTLLVRRR